MDNEELQIFTYEDSLRKKIMLTALVLSPLMLLILIPTFAVVSNPKYRHNALPMILGTIVADLLPAHGFKVVFFILLMPAVVWQNKPYKLKANREGFLDGSRFVTWASIQKASIQNGDFNLKKLLVLDAESSNGTKHTVAISWPLQPQREFESLVSNLPETNQLS